MASIIIDEIVPTKWRLRLRDPEGKTREVEVRAGTPVQLDVEEVQGGKKTDAWVETSQPKERREKPDVDAKDRPRAEATDKSRPSDKPRADATDKARAADKARASRADKPRSIDKSRPADKTRAGKAEPPAKAGHTPKPALEKPEPTPEPPAIRRRKPTPGPGPGGLVWEETEDDGVRGVRASFERGAFKILHAGGDAFGLFYEWNSGKYQALQCGPLEALQKAAAQWTEDGKLHAPRSNLGAEAAKMACAPKDDDLAPRNDTTAANDEGTAKPPAPAKTPAPAAPPVDPEKDKLMMAGFEATVQKLIAARKEAT